MLLLLVLCVACALSVPGCPQFEEMTDDRVVLGYGSSEAVEKRIMVVFRWESFMPGCGDADIVLMLVLMGLAPPVGASCGCWCGVRGQAQVLQL